MASNGERARLARNYGGRLHLDVTVETGEPGHQRRLELETPSGTVRVDLDYGFGFVVLNKPGRHRFDGSDDAGTLARLEGTLALRDHPSQLVVHRTP